MNDCKKIKLLKVYVGNPVEKKDLPDSHYLLVNSFNKGCKCYFLKKNIINQVTQMESVKKAGIEAEYGFLSDRKSVKELIKAGFLIRKLARETEADIVHVYWGSTAALITAFFSPVPVVISFCGSDLLGTVDKDGKTTRLGKISRLLSQIAAVLAYKVITKSEHMKRHLWRVSRNKCTVIPNGVDLSVFRTIGRKEAREVLGWPQEEKTVIFFSGGGAAVKNRDLAETVVALIREKIPEVNLRVVDNVPHEDLPYYYNAADLMLLTSHHEGSNNSVKEAMSCNLPVVAVDCGDVRERLLGVKNSFVADYRSPALLAMKAIEMLGTGERSDGRKYAELVGLERVSGKITDMYKTIVCRDIPGTGGNV